jgi:O-acetyl-ADP-ribose deacetylase (regulator of RNase III)
MDKIELIKGDITQLKVDAIVNAANKTLLGGGGVDGAIHRAAGAELLEECKGLKGCKTGQAKITGGYNLPAKYVIHTVGPVWKGGQYKEWEILRHCYYNSLRLASRHGLQTIAFPNISTGAYRFPKQMAADVAIATVIDYLKGDTDIRKVCFVCFEEENHQIYQQKISEYL